MSVNGAWSSRPARAISLRSAKKSCTADRKHRSDSCDGSAKQNTREVAHHRCDSEAEDCRPRPLEARVGSLAVPMADQDFNQRTLDLWQRRTARKLTAEDGREMAANVSGFFRLLAEWDRQARREQNQSPA